MRATLLVWLLWLAPACFAGAPRVDYCAPVAGLVQRLNSCTDNEILFSDAAVSCLNRFEQDADTAAHSLQKSFARASASQTTSQQGLYQGSESSYAATQLRLSALILSGKRALHQVAEYRANLGMPEDFESAPNMGFSVDAFLKSIPCYEENRQVLLDVGKDLVKKIAELEDARKLASSLQKSTAIARAGVGMDSLPVSAPVSKTLARGSADSGGQKTPAGNSDITGTNRKPAQLNP